MNINLTLLGEMITFIIFVAFTMKYVWPPLKKVLDERTKKIKEGLEAAKESQNQLESAKRKYDEIIKKAREKSNIMIDQAIERAKKYEESLKIQALESTERMKIVAMQELENEKLKLKDNLRKEFVELTILGAETIIKQNVDKAANKKILKDIVKSM